MSETYRATIQGNTIEWEGDGPATSDVIRVEITVRKPVEKNGEPNGKRAMAALGRIAERGGIKSISDPAAWEREIRKDRPLPGRE